MKISSGPLLLVTALVLVPIRVHQQGSFRTITIDTSEVTTPAIAVTPDGRTLVFSAIGHLYELPVAGGATTQLTFGPSYNFDPAMSPDGSRVAFASNRDGSGSNIFVLDRASKRVTQISREVEAARPVWSPDGKTIAYARNVAREDHSLELMPGFADNGLREIRTVSADGGQPAAVGPPLTLESLFYLPDGRLAWSVTERNPGGGMFQSIKQTRIEARQPNGSTSVLVTIGGDPGRVVPGPKGDGVYFGGRGSVQWLPFGANATTTAGPRIQDGSARIALARDGSSVFFGDRGQIWRAALPSGTPERIPFTASMKMEVRPVERTKWQAPAAAASPTPVRAVLSPTMAPDQRRFVVMGAGFLWEQPVGGSPARQIIEGAAFTRDPVFSPDGRKLAFIASENGKRELRVYDFDSEKTSRAVSGWRRIVAALSELESGRPADRLSAHARHLRSLSHRRRERRRRDDTRGGAGCWRMDRAAALLVRRCERVLHEPRREVGGAVSRRASAGRAASGALDRHISPGMSTKDLSRPTASGSRCAATRRSGWRRWARRSPARRRSQTRNSSE